MWSCLLGNAGLAIWTGQFGNVHFIIWQNWMSDYKKKKMYNHDYQKIKYSIIIYNRGSQKKKNIC
jgi:hypothetical protein